MTDRKAVIKNADMSEDMQQDAGKKRRYFTFIPPLSLSFQLILRHKHSKNTTSKKTLPLISKRNSTRNIIQHGTGN